jgi:hypothetical protein
MNNPLTPPYTVPQNVVLDFDITCPNLLCPTPTLGWSANETKRLTSSRALRGMQFDSQN